MLFGLALKNFDIWHQTIQWVKNNATFAPLGVDYHWRAEPIFYGWLPGAAQPLLRRQAARYSVGRLIGRRHHRSSKP